MYPLIEWKKQGGYRKACSSQHESCTVQGRAAQRRTPALLSAVLAVDKDTVVCQWKSRYLVCDVCLWSKRVEQNRNTTEWTSALLSDVRFTLLTIHFSTFPHTTGLSLTLSSVAGLFSLPHLWWLQVITYLFSIFSVTANCLTACVWKCICAVFSLTWVNTLWPLISDNVLTMLTS